jgi:hypothetical protein
VKDELEHAAEALVENREFERLALEEERQMEVSTLRALVAQPKGRLRPFLSPGWWKGLEVRQIVRAIATGYVPPSQIGPTICPECGYLQVHHDPRKVSGPPKYLEECPNFGRRKWD